MGLEIWVFRYDQSNCCPLYICSSFNLFSTKAWNNGWDRSNVTTWLEHSRPCVHTSSLPFREDKQLGALRIPSDKEHLVFIVGQFIHIYFCKALYEHICICIQQSNKHEFQEEQTKYLLKMRMTYENSILIPLHFTAHLNQHSLYCWCQISQYSVKVGIYIRAAT